MSVCVIFNPTARGDKAQEFQRQISTLDNCSLVPTTGPGTAQNLAKQAVIDGFTVVAAAGGDGTLNEVVNGIREAPGGLEKCSFGILPLGTANVFARELGIPIEFQKAWKIITEGVQRRVDLPVAQWGQLEGPQERAFLQMAGVGLDARSIELLDLSLKKKVGPLAYVVSGARAIKEVKTLLTLSMEGKTYSAEAILISNGRFYGGEFPFFPAAELEDGMLDLLLIPRMDWFSAACLGGTFFSERFSTFRGMQHLRSDRVDIHATRVVPFQLDGDLTGHTPISLSIRKRALRVIVPK